MNLGYIEVEQTLKFYESDVDPAYFHGMLSGLICAGVEEDEIDDWLPTLFSGRFMTQSDYERFAEDVLMAFQSLRAELDQDGFGFEILLPDDDNSLDYRVGKMGSWCRGYLVAFLDYAETAVESLPDDCAEFIDDVEQIVDIEIDENEPDEILDESFVMLEEHLRVGVQLVYEHLNPLQHD